MTNEEIANTVIEMLDNAKARIKDDLPADISLIAYDLLHISVLREAIYLSTGNNPKRVKNGELLIELLSAFNRLKDGDFDTFEEELDDICYRIEDKCREVK